MRSKRQRDLALGEALVAAERSTRKLTVVLPLEHRLMRQLVRSWRMQRARVLATLARYASDFPTLSEAIDPAEIGASIDTAIVASPALINAIQVVAENAMLGGATSAEVDLAIEASFSLSHPEAVAWLTKYGADRVSGIDDVTRRYLRTILTDAADNGWSYAKTAAAIKDRFVQFAVGVPQEHIRSRAELVAVTEVGTAYEKGASIVAQGLQAQGIQIEKSWLDVGDENECPECEGNAGDGWIGEGDSYSSGDDEPPAHPACRCTNERRVASAEEAA